MTERGEIQVKGKGAMRPFYLNRSRLLDPSRDVRGASSQFRSRSDLSLPGVVGEEDSNQGESPTHRRADLVMKGLLRMRHEMKQEQQQGVNPRFDRNARRKSSLFSADVLE